MKKKNKQSSTEDKLKILINEYNLCNERIESFLKRQDSLLQISMAILGGSFAFTIVNDLADELFLLIPLIPIVLFTHILYHYTRIITNQGYREYLQIKLNQYLDKENEIKYTSVAKEFLLNKNPMSKVNTIIFIGIIFLSILYSLFMSNLNITVILGNVLNLIFIAFVMTKFFKFTNKLNEKVKNYCQES